jgi:hypothetical protein
MLDGGIERGRGRMWLLVRWLCSLTGCWGSACSSLCSGQCRRMSAYNSSCCCHPLKYVLQWYG